MVAQENIIRETISEAMQTRRGSAESVINPSETTPKVAAYAILCGHVDIDIDYLKDNFERIWAEVQSV